MTAQLSSRVRYESSPLRLRSEFGARAESSPGRRHRWPWFVVGIAAVAAMVAVIVAVTAGAGAESGPSVTSVPGPSASAPAEPAAPTGAEPVGSALAAVDQLTVKGRAPMTGYTRDAYGDGWASVDGCTTRQTVLRRDLSDLTVSGHTCAVLAGTLHDPYTGSTLRLTATTMRTVQIDHVVPLGDSWQKGAQQWSAAQRVRFANDPLNLLVTTGSVNERKGDGDAATWLPPNKSFRCEYVARQVTVKAKYGLWVTPAEKQAMIRVLSSCPDQKLITAQQARQPLDPHAGTDASTTGTPVPTGSYATRTIGATDRHYPTCAAAKHAGLGPYRRGIDPEYAWYRDADGDGIVCEP